MSLKILVILSFVVFFFGCEAPFRADLRKLKSVLQKHGLDVNIAVTDSSTGELSATVNVSSGKFNESVAAELVNCRGLATLNLMPGTDITDGMVRSIAQYPDLKELKLSNSNLKPKQYQMLLEGSKFEMLDISYCTRLSEEVVRNTDYKQSCLKLLHAEGVAKTSFSIDELKVVDEIFRMYYER